MKSPRRIAALLIAGFLAFAPPGTMIFILSLAIIFLGSRWTIVIALLSGAVGITFLLLYRQRHHKRQ
jgi:hypothetical protein